MSSPTVLCRLPNHIGDCCMALPALRLLEASGFTPKIVGKGFLPQLFKGMGWETTTISGKLFQDRAVLNELSQKNNAPLGLLFPNSMNSAMQFRFAGIRSAGLTTDHRSLFLTTKIPEPGTMHEVARFYHVATEAIKAWGKTPAWDEVPCELGLKISPEHQAQALEVRQKNAIPERFALLAPIAKGIHHGKIKYWSEMNKIVEPLRAMGIEPVVIPAPDEVEDAKKVCPDATYLDPVNLGCYAALCQAAQVVVANDSGISHVAASVGAKQLTLIGVTEPTRTGPWNPNAHLAGQLDRWPTVEEVVEKIKAITA